MTARDTREGRRELGVVRQAVGNAVEHIDRGLDLGDVVAQQHPAFVDGSTGGAVADDGRIAVHLLRGVAGHGCQHLRGEGRVGHGQPDEHDRVVAARHGRPKITHGQAHLAGQDIADEVSVRRLQAHLAGQAREKLIHLQVEAAGIGEAGKGGQHLRQGLVLTSGHVKSGFDIHGRVRRHEHGALGFACSTLGEDDQPRAGDDEGGGRDEGDGPAPVTATTVRGGRCRGRHGHLRGVL